MAPQVFSGKYVVQEEIAKGGMGVIYKALDRTLNRIVAIKLVHAHLSGDSSFVERFLREARAMARLQHDNIVTIYAVEEDQQAQFIVMEFCAGSNLRALIRNQPRLPLRDAVSLSHQLASALAYAHAQGIIHRDIKPANVLVDKRGKAKLTDFGIAAALDEASITSTGQVIGTPEYMSPEQARGVKLDGRSDLYSLGIMMYEMLTGLTPYAAISKTAILGKLAYDQEELVLQFPATIPLMLQGVVRDLLRRNPDERMPDAETLANQLHEILYTIPGSPPPAPPADADATILATPPRQTPAQPVPHGDDRTVLASSAETNTAVLPNTSKTRRYPEPLSPPKHSPPLLDETTVLPAQLKQSLSRSSPPVETPASPPVPPSSPPPVAPQTIRPMMLIGGGAAIVLLLAGLVYLLANYGDSSPDNTKPAISKQNDPPPTESVEEQPRAERERMERLQQLENERKRLSDDQARLDDKQRQADLQRKREEADQKELAAQRDRAAKDRESAAQRARADEERRKAQEAARQEPNRQNADADRRRMEADQQRLAKERELAQQKPSTPPIAKVSPEAQLQTLLDRFRRAYERRDLGSLRSLSQMDERRLTNVDVMFSNYETFKTSIQNVATTESEATATLVIDSAVTVNGETVTLAPLARTIKLTVRRQGEGWDKIVW